MKLTLEELVLLTKLSANDWSEPIDRMCTSLFGKMFWSRINVIDAFQKFHYLGLAEEAFMVHPDYGHTKIEARLLKLTFKGMWFVHVNG
jgi:hypothetical protein